MYVELDISGVPPTIALRDSDDFTAFKVVLRGGEHAWVAKDEALRLAGAKSDDPDWRTGFDAMLAFAQSKGWVRDDGAIRAHIEREA